MPRSSAAAHKKPALRTIVEKLRAQPLQCPQLLGMLVPESSALRLQEYDTHRGFLIQDTLPAPRIFCSTNGRNVLLKGFLPFLQKPASPCVFLSRQNTCPGSGLTLKSCDYLRPSPSLYLQEFPRKTFPLQKNNTSYVCSLTIYFLY